MGKKRKGERLVEILTEIHKLRAEVKALAKQQADLAVQIDGLSTRKPASGAARKAAKTRAKPTVARKGSATSKRPVLVSPPDAAAG